MPIKKIRSERARQGGVQSAAGDTGQLAEYRREAKAHWGRTKAYRQSQERAAKFTKEDWRRMSRETDANLKALVSLMAAGRPADSPEVQAEIAKHHAGIERFYDCSTAIYRGLAEMYLADRRFADFYRKYHDDLPEFLSRAMLIYCDRGSG